MKTAIYALVVVTLQLLHRAAAENIPFLTCSDDGVIPLFTPDTVDLKPLHPFPGSRASFTITGTAVRDVEEGSFLAEVFFLIPIRGKERKVKLYEEGTDLCNRVDCPINSGPVVFHYDKQLSLAIPKGKILVRVTASDKSGVLLMCLEVNFTIGVQSLGVEI